MTTRSCRIRDLARCDFLTSESPGRVRKGFVDPGRAGEGVVGLGPWSGSR